MSKLFIPLMLLEIYIDIQGVSEFTRSAVRQPGVMSEEQAVSAIRSRSSPELKRLRAELAQDVDGAEQFLGVLARHADPVVRDWAAWAATQVLPRASALALLERLAEDSDTDVRTEAEQFLVELDRRWAFRLRPRYLEALRSKDPIEVAYAIWHLVQLRETKALAKLRELAGPDQDPFTRDDARIAELVLRNQEDQLIQGLRAHDHRRAALWAKGLAYLGTAGAIEALHEYAQTGPDSECRDRAGRSLAKVKDVAPISTNLSPCEYA